MNNSARPSTRLLRGIPYLHRCDKYIRSRSHLSLLWPLPEHLIVDRRARPVDDAVLNRALDFNTIAKEQDRWRLFQIDSFSPDASKP